MGLALGIDVGGTKVAAGVVDEAGQIIARLRRPSPAANAQSVVDTMIDMARELAASHDIASIGVGAAGYVDENGRIVRFGPNMAWENEPLADKIEAALGLPTRVENDANAAAWGEFKFGAAAEANSIVFITLGTGVGGGIIIGGELFRGSTGSGGEIGHVTVVPGGAKCGCGLLGCWEQYASGGALVRAAKEEAQLNPQFAQTLLSLVDGDPDRMTGYTVTQAAELQCSAAIKAVNSLAMYSGRALSDLARILDPEMFVLAGGISEAGEIVRKPIEEALHAHVKDAAAFTPTPVRTAQLGNRAGMIGAADLSRTALQS
ncbi:ROK family glucokinase [Flaviflexus massiliensis]|uniref:ROK family glucokinase n=1 Tax=Flaviflexus massiliensis TaxID=1522309 RepID=UPI0006D561EC|nr:ROK family glucokinase [Flaviflexus massiliensis]